MSTPLSLNRSLKRSLKKTSIALGVIQALSINSASGASIDVTSRFDLGAGCTLREAITSINMGSATGGCVATGTFGSNDTINVECSLKKRTTSSWMWLQIEV